MRMRTNPEDVVLFTVDKWPANFFFYKWGTDGVLEQQENAEDSQRDLYLSIFYQADIQAHKSLSDNSY